MLPVVLTRAVSVTVLFPVFRVRHWHVLDFDLSDVFNTPKLPALVVCVEGEADTRTPSSTRPTGPVDVGLDVFRWFQLDHQVNLWDVEAPRSYVRSYDTSNSTLLEVFEDVFTSALRNVSVQDFRSLAE